MPGSPAPAIKALPGPRVRGAVPLLSGWFLLRDEVIEGHLEVEGGRVVAWGEGKSERRPDAVGWIVPAPVNAHTHVADTCLRDVGGKPATVAELVGPGGWKHRNLAHATPEQVAAGITAYVGEMAALGTSRFIDFREGGLRGVRALRALAEGLPVQPVILGRPAANTFDDGEAGLILAEADGIGLSARRDFADPRDVEGWAEACHAQDKTFALHASEAKREDMDAILSLEPSFLVHCTQATRHDLESIAGAKVPVVVCPRSNAHYGLKSPVDRMLDAGVQVAVGSDNGMLQTGNLLEDLALLHAWHPRIAVADLLRMATWNGRALAGLPTALPPKPGTPLDLIVLPDPPLPTAPETRPGFLVGPA